MRDRLFFSFLGGSPLAGGGADLDEFARLTLVGKSIGHQLASPIDLPTNVS